MNVFVYNIAEVNLRDHIKPASVDIVTLAVLISKNRLISENFYFRGDGTVMILQTFGLHCIGHVQFSDDRDHNIIPLSKTTNRQFWLVGRMSYCNIFHIELCRTSLDPSDSCHVSRSTFLRTTRSSRLTRNEPDSSRVPTTDASPGALRYSSSAHYVVPVDNDNDHRFWSNIVPCVWKKKLVHAYSNRCIDMPSNYVFCDLAMSSYR
ncbi:hypothetical protein Tco_0998448 [Tanacetum coccineum]